nr:recombinase family protein [Mesorhizobium sp.]
MQRVRPKNGEAAKHKEKRIELVTRVALNARYSSDNQRDASIEDQLRQWRERAVREGWTVVESYSDRAVSGASLTGQASSPCLPMPRPAVSTWCCPRRSTASAATRRMWRGSSSA